MRRDRTTPTIVDPTLAPERKPWVPPAMREPRSTDAVANALHDIRTLLHDLSDRVDALESHNDDESLDADLREITNRLDELENQVGI